MLSCTPVDSLAPYPKRFCGLSGVMSLLTTAARKTSDWPRTGAEFIRTARSGINRTVLVNIFPFIFQSIYQVATTLFAWGPTQKNMRDVCRLDVKIPGYNILVLKFESIG